MKKIAMFVFAIMLCTASLYAQKPKTIDYAGRIGAPTVDEPAVLTKIFSNLGPATAAYAGSAWLLTGPLSASGGSQFIAMPFTPKQNAHVSQVRAAVQYNASGANQVNLSLYSDASGAPGTLLAGPVTVKNLPTFYTCCKTANASFPAVAVTAGTQYWIVADTPTTGTGSDLEGVWCFVPPTKILVGADENSGGWFNFASGSNEPAGAAYGSIP